jgi:ABC-type glutathione transport system ATPase component
MVPRPAPAPGDPPLVKVTDLVKHFPIRGGIMQRTIGMVQAVDGVSFEIRRGETLGWSANRVVARRPSGG